MNHPGTKFFVSRDRFQLFKFRASVYGNITQAESAIRVRDESEAHQRRGTFECIIGFHQKSHGAANQQ